uniref:Uncharacterized protein n=1 Tax=Timema douglasi TaxID=61478 RepID=A0A7R8V9L9_TIMDO|nr:unnamed protein product [Timema douglasi]
MGNPNFRDDTIDHGVPSHIYGTYRHLQTGANYAVNWDDLNDMADIEAICASLLPCSVDIRRDPSVDYSQDKHLHEVSSRDRVVREADYRVSQQSGGWFDVISIHPELGMNSALWLVSAACTIWWSHGHFVVPSILQMGNSQDLQYQSPIAPSALELFLGAIMLPNLEGEEHWDSGRGAGKVIGNKVADTRGRSGTRSKLSRLKDRLVSGVGGKRMDRINTVMIEPDYLLLRIDAGSRMVERRHSPFPPPPRPTHLPAATVLPREFQRRTGGLLAFQVGTLRPHFALDRRLR